MECRTVIMLLLRGATLASKFLLVIFLAKFATYKNLADYTIIAVTISYLLFFLGFDFYTYSTREIIKKGFTKSGELLCNQLYLYISMYLILIPIVYGLNYFSVLSVGVLFYFVVITEHFAQECMRIIIINNKPVKANFQFFLRSSFWIYIYIAYCYWKATYSLDILLLFWLISNVCSIVYSVSEFKMINYKDDKIYRVDFKWIKKGVAIAIPLLVTTLMLRGGYVTDRYILKYLSSTEVLAVYSFYSNMSNALIAFIDAAVIMIFYPKVISAYNELNIEEYNKTLVLFKRNVVKVGCCSFFILSVAVPVICLFLNKSEFINSIIMFY
ncbi:O136 family O-antigen flippase, partial [Escherichia coli]